MRARLSQALVLAARSILATLWRAAQQLFHEAAGALFVFFALAGGISAWRTWRLGAAPWLTALAIGFALMMAAFALAAFRSARRVR